MNDATSADVRRQVWLENARPAKNQPDWVCDDCGHRYGRWYDVDGYVGPSSHAATYHTGKCDVCLQEKSVTEARDFGYLRPGWEH